MVFFVPSISLSLSVVSFSTETVVIGIAVLSEGFCFVRQIVHTKCRHRYIPATRNGIPIKMAIMTPIIIQL